MQLQRIIVGVDFSEPSLAAARWTAHYFAPEAELVILHSTFVPQPPRFLRGLFPAPRNLVETARVGAEARLLELARELGADRAGKIYTYVRTGSAVEQLVACASEVEADMIVVGKHGERAGVWDWLGSTAEGVLLTSTVPVLLASGMSERVPQKLLVAIEEANVTPWVLRWARLLAERFDGRVTALHAVRTLSAPQALAVGNMGTGGVTLDPDILDVELQFGAERWMKTMIDAGFDRDHTKSEVTFGEPDYEIVRAAERFGSDLIVIGNRGSSGIPKTLLGSVVRGVLRRAPCPTLVVSEPDDEIGQ